MKFNASFNRQKIRTQFCDPNFNHSFIGIATGIPGIDMLQVGRDEVDFVSRVPATGIRNWLRAIIYRRGANP